jgi:hypothetical protein
MTELKVSIVDHPFTAESWDKAGSNIMGLVNGKEVLFVQKQFIKYQVILLMVTALFKLL